MGGEETPPRPLPPPPRPRRRPRDLPRPPAASPRRSSVPGAGRGGASADDPPPRPLPVPVPHAHPLAALPGGRAGAAEPRAPAGQRLDPTFLNPARVAAFASGSALAVQRQLPSSPPPVSALATATALSTRVVERQWRLELEHHPGGGSRPELTQEERVLAATDAAALRQALCLRETEAPADAATPERSALARAMERKVGKQLDAEWERARLDPDRRPPRAGARERPEEQELYESLPRLSLSGVARGGGDSGGRAAVGDDDVVGPRSRLWTRPLSRRGFVGLPGGCFDPLQG